MYCFDNVAVMFLVNALRVAYMNLFKVLYVNILKINTLLLKLLF